VNKDTLHVVMSDMHSGSVNALTVDRIWRGQQTADIQPSPAQQRIREQFVKFADAVKIARINCKVRLILNGDLIEGVHHNQSQIFTQDELEMAEISAELINEFKGRIDWQQGDEVYVTRGTTTHVKTLENRIGQEVGAVMDGDFYVHSKLTLNTNGIISVIAHTGPSVGKGQNEGNSLRNFMNNYYISCCKDGIECPSIFYFAHVHQPYYSVIEERLPGFSFRTLHGIITPSWQTKTVYALDKMPMERNRIGGVYQLITADGMIGTPVFSVLET